MTRVIDAPTRDPALDRLTRFHVKTLGIRLGQKISVGGWGTVYYTRGDLSTPERRAGSLTTSNAPLLQDPPPPKRRSLSSIFSLPTPSFTSGSAYAVKVIMTAPAGSTLRNMQEDEVKIHMRAGLNDHPGIVKLQRVVMEKQFTFLVMVRCSFECISLEFD